MRLVPVHRRVSRPPVVHHARGGRAPSRLRPAPCPRQRPAAQLRPCLVRPVPHPTRPYAATALGPGLPGQARAHFGVVGRHAGQKCSFGSSPTLVQGGRRIGRVPSSHPTSLLGLVPLSRAVHILQRRIGLWPHPAFQMFPYLNLAAPRCRLLSIRAFWAGATCLHASQQEAAHEGSSGSPNSPSIWSRKVWNSAAWCRVEKRTVSLHSH